MTLAYELVRKDERILKPKGRKPRSARRCTSIEDYEKAFHDEVADTIRTGYVLVCAQGSSPRTAAAGVYYLKGTKDDTSAGSASTA